MHKHVTKCFLKRYVIESVDECHVTERKLTKRSNGRNRSSLGRPNRPIFRWTSRGSRLRGRYAQISGGRDARRGRQLVTFSVSFRNGVTGKSETRAVTTRGNEGFANNKGRSPNTGVGSTKRSTKDMRRVLSTTEIPET